MEFLYLFLRHQFYGESNGGMAKRRLVSKVSKSSAIFSSTAPRAVRPFSVVKFTIYVNRQLRANLFRVCGQHQFAMRNL